MNDLQLLPHDVNAFIVNILISHTSFICAAAGCSCACAISDADYLLCFAHMRVCVCSLVRYGVGFARVPWLFEILAVRACGLDVSTLLYMVAVLRVCVVVLVALRCSSCWFGIVTPSCATSSWSLNANATVELLACWTHRVSHCGTDGSHCLFRRLSPMRELPFARPKPTYAPVRFKPIRSGTAELRV